MITAEIIADSLNTANGCRLTSWVLTYPRFIHSEILTHRVFSKNSASSRAIPTEKIIQEIIDNPAMPEFWGKNQKGMQAVEELDDIVIREHRDVLESIYGGTATRFFRGTECAAAKTLWLSARDFAIQYAKLLQKIGLHKQIANRILEPWFHMRVILSGTEYGNFFALRAHKDAQPEFQKLAFLMLEKYNASVPNKLEPGEWHIPFGDRMDEIRIQESTSQELLQAKIKIAVARCARVSYLNFYGKDDYAADMALCDRLFSSTPRHLSPTEHVAQAVPDDRFIGNFRGFKQYRKMFPDENLKDERIKP